MPEYTKRAVELVPGDVFQHEHHTLTVVRVDPPAHFAWYVHVVATDADGVEVGLTYTQHERVRVVEVAS